ncbi:hypothetical protein CSC3H3_06865 [Thalassospira marina]|uniref:Uncharacterized protein n=1 Tax=Thalassospira marina TaxID=2048283 RepID=A0ABM6Q7I3_9PROT|nr:hypothetical protein CSC3H3_06865 [Thalassospira marina]
MFHNPVTGKKITGRCNVASARFLAVFSHADIAGSGGEDFDIGTVVFRYERNITQTVVGVIAQSSIKIARSCKCLKSVCCFMQSVTMCRLHDSSHLAMIFGIWTDKRQK